MEGFHSVDRSSAPQDAIGRRYAAEHEALLEVLAIFAHDLSNPLQSISVLCELAADDAPEGSEESVRNRQCLQAADRMRALVHGLAAITRRDELPMRLTVLHERVMALLERRFERYNIAVDAQLEPAALAQVAGFDLVLINLCLAAIAAAAEAGLPRYRLGLRTRSRLEVPVLELEFTGYDRGDVATPVKFCEATLQRARDGAAGTTTQLEVDGSRVRVGLG